MKSKAIAYWDAQAAESEAAARDAVLCGAWSERSFDETGREDAEHLILPFVKRSDTILDVGCGMGRLLKHSAMVGRRAIGLDVSKEMLARAANRLEGAANVSLKRLPVSLRFPVPDRCVDFAYFYHVSEHMEREDAFRILAEMRRCLKATGIALIQFSLLEHPDNEREFRTWARLGDEEGVRSRFYSEQEATTLLRMTNFFPQLRLYVPGEFVVVATKADKRVLGQMPLVPLAPCGD